MQVELHDQFKQTTSMPASRVVVYDDYGNPIAAVIQIDDGQYVATTVSQKQFQNILKAMGITKTLVVEHIDPQRLKPLE